MTKRLFDEQDHWIDQTHAVQRDISPALERTFAYYAGLGYSIRDLANIAHACVSEAECKQMMLKGRQE